MSRWQRPPSSASSSLTTSTQTDEHPDPHTADAYLGWARFGLLLNLAAEEAALLCSGSTPAPQHGHSTLKDQLSMLTSQMIAANAATITLVSSLFRALPNCSTAITAMTEAAPVDASPRDVSPSGDGEVMLEKSSAPIGDVPIALQASTSGEPHECPICKMMREGGCEAAFEAFMDCGAEADKGNRDYNDCLGLFEAMRECMMKRPDVFHPMLGSLEDSPEDPPATSATKDSATDKTKAANS
ncbi:hypothetical protein QJQ45_019710 [Haematococcus lacustris]|nr:hypothetical protein QJQ45_019710 [Haematococcus lacustris]